MDDNQKESERMIKKKISNQKSRKLNEELITRKEENKFKIFVLGVGGAGNNTLTRLSEIGMDNVTTIAINTDAQDLYYCQADEKILIGEKTLHGLGAGGEPNLAKECAEVSEDEIYEKLEDGDLVIVFYGLGGGTGTGSGPIISKIAKKRGALTVTVVTLPLSSEGNLRRENVEKGLKILLNNTDTVFTFPIDILFEIFPNLPINKVFLVLEEILAQTVKTITEFFTKPSVFNVDFTDIKKMMQDSGMAMISIDESDSADKALEPIHKSLNSPLVDLDLYNSKGAIINISSSSQLDLYEYENIVQIVADKLNPKAKIIWLAHIDDSLENIIKTAIITTGKSHNIYQNTHLDENRTDDSFKFRRYKLTEGFTGEFL